MASSGDKCTQIKWSIRKKKKNGAKTQRDKTKGGLATIDQIQNKIESSIWLTKKKRKVKKKKTIAAAETLQLDYATRSDRFLCQSEMSEICSLR